MRYIKSASFPRCTHTLHNECRLICGYLAFRENMYVYRKVTSTHFNQVAVFPTVKCESFVSGLRSHPYENMQFLKPPPPLHQKLHNHQQFFDIFCGHNVFRKNWEKFVLHSKRVIVSLLLMSHSGPHFHHLECNISSIILLYMAIRGHPISVDWV